MSVRSVLCLTCTVCVAWCSPALCGSGGTRRPPAPKGSVAKAPSTPAANKANLAAKTAAAPAAKPTTAPSAVDAAPQAGIKSYKLRYKFKPGEALRWEVEHRAKIRTTVQGTTQTAETSSASIKVWKVESVDTEGNATFVYSVERVDMTQKFDGRQEMRYNSTTDTKPPQVFENVAKAVGTPLATLTLDPLGAVTKREENYVQAAPLQENVTLPLPENALSTGEEWTMPADITVTLPDGERKVTKKIKARQLYRLESVDDGVATIRLETQVLTPVNDPQIEAQIVQSKANGTVHFDITAGRIVSQQSDIDEHVNGFQGAASSMHYITRFSEKLLPDASRAAVFPQAPKTR
jgi:hypothetical protein